MITIFKNITSATAPYYRDVSVVVERIKKGTSKALIERIRPITEKHQRDVLKAQLPSICFSGTFSQRNNKSLIEHSGLICVDFDKFPDFDTLMDKYDSIKSDNFTHISFISPSGDGFKVVVKIPKCYDDKTHDQYFKGLREYYQCPYFDSNANGLSRVCYESYDPLIYVNQNSDVFEDRMFDEGNDVYEKEVLFKVTNDDEIIKRVDEFWRSKFKFVDGNRNKSVHILCNYLNEFGVSKEIALNHVLQYKQADFTDREIKNALNSAYKKVENHNSRFFEDNKIIEIIEQMLKNGKSKKEIKTYLFSKTIAPDNIDEVIDSIYSSEKTVIFYEKVKSTIVIYSLKYKEFLKERGFSKYYPENSDAYIFVRQIGNVYEEVTAERIKAFVLKHLEQNQIYDVYEHMSKKSLYFTDDYLSILDEIDIKFCNDTRDSAFLFYRNKAIEITKNKIVEHDYIDLGAFVWKSQVIDRDIYINKANQDNDYLTFLRNVSGMNYDRMRTVIGYLLHSYKSKSNTKAIILNDEMISENPEGGTGKGLLVQGIKQLKKVVTEDGKKFKMDKSFAFQKLEIDTQILFIDDISRGFNFESLFSIITEGIDIEKKNQTTIYIPVERSPKIIISTNYPIKGVGHSFDRRKIEIELKQYYSSNKTPIDDFGRALFDDWNKDEFNKFDNFMVSCVHEYMIKGLVEPEASNGKLRKFIAETSQEFYDFIQSQPANGRLYKAQLRDDFKKEYPDYLKLSEKRFTTWIKLYFKFIGVEFIESSDQLGGRFVEVYKPNELNSLPIIDPNPL